MKDLVKIIDAGILKSGFANKIGLSLKTNVGAGLATSGKILTSDKKMALLEILLKKTRRIFKEIS